MLIAAVKTLALPMCRTEPNDFPNPFKTLQAFLNSELLFQLKINRKW